MDLPYDNDERTPLLQPRIPSLLPFTNSNSPTPPTQSKPQFHQPHTHTHTRSNVNLSISQLFHIFAALKQGHLPSTGQTLDLIEYLLSSPLLQDTEQGTIYESRYGQGRIGVGRLSREGDNVRSGIRKWLESSRELMKERTQGEGERDGWQELVWSMRNHSLEIELPSAPTLLPQTSQKSPITSSLLSLLSLFFTSPDIRQLLIDLIVLIRDVAQVTLATEVREERVPEEVKEGLEKVVDFAAGSAVGKVAIDQEMKEESKRKVGIEKTQGDMEEGEMEDPPLVEDTFEGDEIVHNGREESAANSGDEAIPVIPDQTAEELRDTFIDRLKSILTRLQATEQYQQAMRTLLSIVRSQVKESLSALEPSISIEPSSETPTSRKPPSPLSLLLPLLEPFTGGPSSLDPLRTTSNSLLSHFSTSNPSSTPHSLLELFSTLDRFLSLTLLDPDYLGSSKANRTLGQLHDSFASLGSDHPEFYRDLQSFFGVLLDAVSKISRDEYLSKFGQSSLNLGLALEGWIQAAGRTAVLAASGRGVEAIWGDLIEWLAPRILGIVQEIPLPRIEFKTPQVEGAIESPTLVSTSFVPSRVTIKNSTSLTYLPSLGRTKQDIPPFDSTPLPPSEDTSWNERTSYSTRTNIEVTGLRLEVLDVGYHVRVNTGIPCFPHLTESGLVDLHFGSHPEGGMSFSIDTSSLPQSQESLFKMLDSSKVDLRRFDVRPHETDHPWLMFFLRPVLRTAVRKAVEVEVRKVLMQQGDRLGEWAWRVKEHKKVVDRDDAKGRKDGQEGGIWNWVKAIWRTSTEEREEGDEGQEENTTTEFHLNRHGVSIDLPRPVNSSNGEEGTTVGFGTEGVVIPEGEATIPEPEGRERIGVVAKTKEEVNEAVNSGKKAVRSTWGVVGGIGEAREEWSEDVEEEREKYERQGWRSDAFDLGRRG
ncbi:hypothetical protein JCM5353_004927 [Sporobolomyces roseus]